MNNPTNSSASYNARAHATPTPTSNTSTQQHPQPKRTLLFPKATPSGNTVNPTLTNAAVPTPPPLAAAAMNSLTPQRHHQQPQQQQHTAHLDAASSLSPQARVASPSSSSSVATLNTLNPALAVVGSEDHFTGLKRGREGDEGEGAKGHSNSGGHGAAVNGHTCDNESTARRSISFQSTTSVDPTQQQLRPATTLFMAGNGNHHHDANDGFDDLGDDEEEGGIVCDTNSTANTPSVVRSCSTSTPNVFNTCNNGGGDSVNSSRSTGEVLVFSQPNAVSSGGAGVGGGLSLSQQLLAAAPPPQPAAVSVAHHHEHAVAAGVTPTRQFPSSLSGGGRSPADPSAAAGAYCGAITTAATAQFVTSGGVLTPRAAPTPTATPQQSYQQQQQPQQHQLTQQQAAQLEARRSFAPEVKPKRTLIVFGAAKGTNGNAAANDNGNATQTPPPPPQPQANSAAVTAIELGMSETKTQAMMPPTHPASSAFSASALPPLPVNNSAPNNTSEGPQQNSNEPKPFQFWKRPSSAPPPPPVAPRNPTPPPPPPPAVVPQHHPDRHNDAPHNLPSTPANVLANPLLANTYGYNLPPQPQPHQNNPSTSATGESSSKHSTAAYMANMATAASSNETMKKQKSHHRFMDELMNAIPPEDPTMTEARHRFTTSQTLLSQQQQMSQRNARSSRAPSDPLPLSPPLDGANDDGNDGYDHRHPSQPPNWFYLYHGCKVPPTADVVDANDSDDATTVRGGALVVRSAQANASSGQNNTTSLTYRRPLPTTFTYDYADMASFSPQNLYNIPFPYASPYTLQRNAMNVLRAAIEANNRYFKGGAAAAVAKQLSDARREKAKALLKAQKERERQARIDAERDKARFEKMRKKDMRRAARNGYGNGHSNNPPSSSNSKDDYSQCEASIDAYSNCGSPLVATFGRSMLPRGARLPPRGMTDVAGSTTSDSEASEGTLRYGDTKRPDTIDNSDDDDGVDKISSDDADSLGDGLSDIEEGDIREAVESLRSGASCGVSVLEAPTGTGKTHMLLNAVLSWLSLQRFKGAVARRQLLMAERRNILKHFEQTAALPAAMGAAGRSFVPEGPVGEAAREVGNTDWRYGRSDGGARKNARRRGGNKRGGGDGMSSSSAAMATDGLDAFSPREALVSAEEQERDARKKAAALLGSTFMDSSSSSDSDDNARSNNKSKQKPLSSSSRPNGGDGEDDNDSDDDLPFTAQEQYDMLFGMTEEQCLRYLGTAELSTQIPLVKPKVWFSSRTHSQLQQCSQEMYITAYAKAATAALSKGLGFNPYYVPPETAERFVDFLRSPEDPLYRPVSDLDMPSIEHTRLSRGLPEPDGTQPMPEGGPTNGRGEMDANRTDGGLLFADGSSAELAAMLVDQQREEQIVAEGRGGGSNNKQQQKKVPPLPQPAAADDADDDNANFVPLQASTTTDFLHLPAPAAAGGDGIDGNNPLSSQAPNGGSGTTEKEAPQNLADLYPVPIIPVRNAPIAAYTPIMPLSFVHIGSRQQLCIHRAIKDRCGPGQGINDVCRDAMVNEREAVVEARKRLASGKHKCQPRGGIVIGDGGQQPINAQSLTANAFSSGLDAGLNQAAAAAGDGARQQQQQQSLVDIEDVIMEVKTERKCLGPCDSCAYSRYDKLKELRAEIRKRGSMELPDLRDLGIRIGACPYLASRQMVRSADVVFIYFNYLVDDTMTANITRLEPIAEGSAAEVNDYNRKENARMERERAKELKKQMYSTNSFKDNDKGDADADAKAEGSGENDGGGPNTSSGRSGDTNNLNRRTMTAMWKKKHLLSEDNIGYVFSRLVARSCLTPNSLAGDVVIFDEGHNVVEVARGVLRADITYSQLRRARNVFAMYYDKYGRFMKPETADTFRMVIDMACKLQRYLRQSQRAFVGRNGRPVTGHVTGGPHHCASKASTAHYSEETKKELSRGIAYPESGYAKPKPSFGPQRGDPQYYHMSGSKQVVRDDGFSSFTFDAEIANVNIADRVAKNINTDVLRKMRGLAKNITRQIANLSCEHPNVVTLDGFGSPFFNDTRRYGLFTLKGARALAASGGIWGGLGAASASDCPHARAVLDGMGLNRSPLSTPLHSHSSSPSSAVLPSRSLNNIIAPRRGGRAAAGPTATAPPSSSSSVKVTQWKFWQKYGREKAFKAIGFGGGPHQQRHSSSDMYGSSGGANSPNNYRGGAGGVGTPSLYGARQQSEREAIDFDDGHDDLDTRYTLARGGVGDNGGDDADGNGFDEFQFVERGGGADDSDDDEFMRGTRRIAGGHYGLGSNGGMPKLAHERDTKQVESSYRKKGVESYANFRYRQEYLEQICEEPGFSDVDEIYTDENDPLLDPPIMPDLNNAQNQNQSVADNAVAFVRTRDAYPEMCLLPKVFGGGGGGSLSNPDDSASFYSSVPQVASAYRSASALHTAKEERARRIRTLCYKYDHDGTGMQDPRVNCSNTASRLTTKELDLWVQRETLATSLAVTTFMDVLKKFESARESTRILVGRSDDVIGVPGRRINSGKSKGGRPAAAAHNNSFGGGGEHGGAVALSNTRAKLDCKGRVLPPTILSMCVFPVDASSVMRHLMVNCRHIVVAGGTLAPLPITIMPILPVGCYQFYPFGHIVKAEKALRVCTLATTPNPTLSLHGDGYTGTAESSSSAAGSNNSNHNGGGNGYHNGQQLGRRPCTKFHFTYANNAVKGAMFNQGCEMLLQLSAIIPEGLIVFFASYEAMNQFWTVLEKAYVPEDFVFTRSIVLNQHNSHHNNGGDQPSPTPTTSAAAYSYRQKQKEQQRSVFPPRTTFFDAISRFKKIFKESRDRETDEMLKEYEDYIENNIEVDDGGKRAVNPLSLVASNGTQPLSLTPFSSAAGVSQFVAPKRTLLSFNSGGSAASSASTVGGLPTPPTMPSLSTGGGSSSNNNNGGAQRGRRMEDEAGNRIRPTPNSTLLQSQRGGATTIGGSEEDSAGLLPEEAAAAQENARLLHDIERLMPTREVRKRNKTEDMALFGAADPILQSPTTAHDPSHHGGGTHTNAANSSSSAAADSHDANDDGPRFVPNVNYRHPATPAPMRLSLDKPHHRGAIMTCVIGGRLSEGINFNDHKGRGVVVFGMGVANPFDAENDLVLDTIATKRNAARNRKATSAMNAAAAAGITHRGGGQQQVTSAPSPHAMGRQRKSGGAPTPATSTPPTAAVSSSSVVNPSDTEFVNPLELLSMRSTLESIATLKSLTGRDAARQHLNTTSHNNGSGGQLVSTTGATAGANGSRASGFKALPYYQKNLPSNAFVSANAFATSNFGESGGDDGDDGGDCTGKTLREQKQSLSNANTMKSVNQAIGRCIRHMNDYAVIVLADERYGSDALSSRIPSWMGGGLRNFAGADTSTPSPSNSDSSYRNGNNSNNGGGGGGCRGGFDEVAMALEQFFTDKEQELRAARQQ